MVHHVSSSPFMSGEPITECQWLTKIWDIFLIRHITKLTCINFVFCYMYCCLLEINLTLCVTSVASFFLSSRCYAKCKFVNSQIFLVFIVLKVSQYMNVYFVILFVLDYITIQLLQSFTFILLYHEICKKLICWAY